MLPTSCMNFGVLRETAQRVLLTQVEVEMDLSPKAIHHETNHAGKCQAWIYRDRLHGPAHRAEVAGSRLQAESARPRPAEGGRAGSIRRNRRTERLGTLLK